MEKENENHVMSDFDMHLIAQFFSKIDRQGPGSDTESLKALQLIKNFLPQRPRVADIGCGTGRQSMALAKAMDCEILSLDLMPEMVQGVEMRSEREHLTHQITPVQGDMHKLPFDHNFFDLIWSEGAIYNLGFEQGLKAWHPYLKNGGFVVVTDCSWLTEQRPEDSTWLLDNFLDLDSIPNKIASMQRAGYQAYGHFILQQRAWEENYYQPMERLIPVFMADHVDDPTAKMLTDNLLKEISYYRKYGAYYGYVFYIGQKLP